MKKINSRLYEFITEDQHITSKKFAEITGIKEKLIIDIIIGETETLDKVTISKISKVYPNLNMDWLINGTGEKIIQKTKKKTRNHWKNIDPNEEKDMMKPISERITKLRNERKLTMPDVAKVIGIGMSGYSALEQGYAKLTVAKLIKLKRYYKVSYDYLLDGVKEDPERIQELDEANKMIKFLNETNDLLREQVALLKEKNKRK